MEKILTKLEEKFDSQMKSFEEHPIKTGIKWLVIIWALKKLWSWVKDDVK